MSDIKDLRNFLNRRKQVKKDTKPATREDEVECEDDCLNIFDSDVELLKKEESEFHTEMKNEKDYTEIFGEDIKGGRYTRIVIIGDFFLKQLIECWPSKSPIKPYFLYKNKLSIRELHLKFENHHFLKNSNKVLLLIVLGLHDFAQYGPYSNSTCSSVHNFVEYIHGLKPVDGYLKELLGIKEAFLTMENLSVVFTYLPRLYNIKVLKDIFKWSENKVTDCECSGVVPDLFDSDIVNELHLYQKQFVTEQLNFLRECGTFEYYGPPITFVDGKWIYAMDPKKIEKKSAVLNYVLNDFIFDTEDVDKLENVVENHYVGMRANILRNKFRIAVVGDKWVECIARRWSSDYTEWPFFYFCDYFTFKDLRRAALSFIKNNEIGLVMTAVPAGEFFTIKTSSKCKGHKPLEYPVPHKDLIKNPQNFAKQLIGKIMELLQEIKTVRKHCGIVFMTCYPVQFSSYYEFLAESHFNAVGESAHGNDSPIDVNFSDFYTKIAECSQVINQYIDTVIRKQKLPSCDISRVVNSSIESFVFPTYIEGKCPSVPLETALHQCVEKCVGIYKELIVSKKLSFTHTEKYLKELQSRKEHPENGNLEGKKKNIKRSVDDNAFGLNKRSKISDSGPGLKRESLISRPRNDDQYRSRVNPRVNPRVPLTKNLTQASPHYRSSVDAFRSTDSRGNFDRQLTNYRLRSRDDTALLARSNLLRYEPNYPSTLGSFATREYRLTSDKASTNFVPSGALRDRGTSVRSRPPLDNYSAVNSLASRIYGLMTDPRLNDLDAVRGGDARQFGGSFTGLRHELLRDSQRENFDSRSYGRTDLLSFGSRNDARGYRASDDNRLAKPMIEDISRSHSLLGTRSTEERLRFKNLNPLENRESINRRLGPRVDRPSSDVFESLASIDDRQRPRDRGNQYGDTSYGPSLDRPAMTVLKSLAAIGDRRHYEQQLRKHSDAMANGSEETGGTGRAPMPVRDRYEINRLTSNMDILPNYAQIDKYFLNGSGLDANTIQGVSLRKLAALDVLSTIGVVKDPPSKIKSKLKV